MVEESEQFDGRSVRELLALSRSILRELRRRGVIRTGNAPTGDYAELLVQLATGGELATNSQASWDIVTPEPNPEHLQVKSRIVTGAGRGERQLSPARSWEFDAAVLVLFDDDYRVMRAARVSVAELRDDARWAKHVNGWLILRPTDCLRVASTGPSGSATRAIDSSTLYRSSDAPNGGNPSPMTSKRRPSPTPAGGSYSIAVYVDLATMEEVDENDATEIVISEYDEADRLLFETVGSVKQTDRD